MTGPLEGLRVVDCTRGTAGTRAAGLLADYGADVIWVEPPGGDPLRSELAVPYSVFNRGKRSIELDLRGPDGQATLRALLEGTDVMVSSWRPGVAEELGLGFDELHKLHPSLVCASISGWGPTSQDLPGYESLVYAVVGTMVEQVGHRDGPIYLGLPFATIGAAHLAVIGILAALYRRLLDGVGRLVETSLVDGALSYHSMTWFDSDVGTAPHKSGKHRNIALTFLCADGEYVSVHTGAVGAYRGLMEVLGVADRIAFNESGIEFGVPLSAEEQRIISEDLPKIFLTRPCAEWVDALLAADLCVMPNLRPGEIFDQPQVRHNEMVIRVHDPILGPLEQVAPPIKLSETPGRARGPAPKANEHRKEILSQIQDRDHLSMSVSAPAVTGPLLDGLHILDLGLYYAGPYASRLLADLGADVIHVESLAGDPTRGMEAVYRSGFAGKRGMAVNLKSPDVEPIVRKLLEWADVVHHNMRPGADKRLGVDYDTARGVNPRIVYLHAPGWGSTGPDVSRQSFAPVMSSYVGVGHEVGGEFNPPLPSFGNEDPGNGLLGAIGILLGLLHRSHSGQGQHLECPQLHAAMTHLSHIVRKPDGKVLGAGRLDTLQYGFSALDRLFETSDGWICICASRDEEFRSLCEALAIDLHKENRFATRAARAENDYSLGERLADVFGAHSTKYSTDVLRSHHVPAVVPAGKNTAAFMRDPANLASGRVSEIPDRDRGHLREIAQLIRVSDANIPPHRSAPRHGEHTDEILILLGIGLHEIADLRARQVVR